jgi:hypothetical protein
VPVALACDFVYGFGFYRGLWRSWRGKAV